MGYKRILIPLDGSELAEKALAHVAEIAAPGAILHILSIVTENKNYVSAVGISSAYGASLIADTPALNMHDPRFIHDRLSYLEDVMLPFQEKGYTVTLDAIPGNGHDVVQNIIDLALDGYDCILMATHGRTGLQKALLGSVAQSVVVRSPCPVILIPAGM